MPVRKSINHIPPSPVKVNLEEESLMKQGIGTILRSDCDTSRAGSIRRTLSADMSSKKWLEQNGFLSPMKKTVSSEALLHPSAADSSSSSSSEIAEDEFEQIQNQDDVWRKIQERNQIQKSSENQVWGSILTQKKSENSALPPPYVHPLVKRSASTLTHKSLEICTESLGSETGSDCFSSLSDAEEDRPRVEAQEFKDSNPFPDLHVAKYRKSPARSFPPPLPSISGGDGASLHMQSHRENGRLVLEAVSVPPRNYFHAQRQDGRLLLTLIHAPATSSPEDDEIEKVFDDDMEGVDDDDDEEEYTQEEEEQVVEEKSLSLPSGMIKVHKSGIGMKRLVGNINPNWSKKMDEELPIPQSLPPRGARFNQAAAAGAAASFNVYEYFWRNKTAAGFLNPMITNKMNGTKGYENQDLVLMRANKTEQFVPYLRGCKEARRSLATPEPSCWIATS
ncbi:hypothetical protein ACS0TY_020572 [Phlomoides rotata]